MSNDSYNGEEAKAPYTKLVTKVKRGTGTRDQDVTKVVTRHPDPERAATNHQKAIQAARRSAVTARAIQPEVDTDG